MEIKYLHIKTSSPKINWIKPSKFKLHSICFIIHTIKIYIHNNSHLQIPPFFPLWILCISKINCLQKYFYSVEYICIHTYLFPHIIYKHTHIYVHTLIYYINPVIEFSGACHGIYFYAECIYPHRKCNIKKICFLIITLKLWFLYLNLYSFLKLFSSNANSSP